MFPAEPIPDGAIFAPHHFTLGVMLLLFVVWRVSDDIRDKEAWIVALSAGASIVGFLFTWKYHPVTGALLTLIGVVTAGVAILSRQYWRRYNWLGSRGVALLSVLIALDDAIEHSFGIPTPLDLAWSHFIYPVIIKAIESSV